MLDERINFDMHDEELIEFAYLCCKRREFKKSYGLIQNLVKKYKISFYPIVCLNLEKFEEIYEYYHSTFNDKNIESIWYGDKDFLDKCKYSLALCIVAHKFKTELKDGFNFFDEDKKISITEYLNLREIAFNYLNEADYSTARIYFKKVLNMFNRDSQLWQGLADTYYTEMIGEEVNLNLIEAYLALKCAIKLEAEENEDMPFEYDFSLHYKMIHVIFHLKALGLEQPNLVFEEISKLKSCAISLKEKETANQLENNIINIEREFQF